MIHDLRLKEDVKVSEEEDELTEYDFEHVLEKLKKKAPEKYNYLLKAGDSMKRVVFKIFKHIYDTEERPDEWLNTRIIQIYKGKGDSADFNNHRNIHTKAVSYTHLTLPTNREV